MALAALYKKMPTEQPARLSLCQCWLLWMNIPWMPWEKHAMIKDNYPGSWWRSSHEDLQITLYLFPARWEEKPFPVWPSRGMLGQVLKRQGCDWCKYHDCLPLPYTFLFGFIHRILRLAWCVVWETLLCCFLWHFNMIPHKDFFPLVFTFLLS